jgi:murein L,D-transpeptidase YafK
MKTFFALMILSFSLPLLSQTIDEVRVFKSKHRMDMLSNGKIVKSYRVMLGRGGKGPKQKRGDNLVPEGKYSLDYKNPYSNFYKSIHISYPNDEDIKRSYEQGVDPGGDIMIHGFPNHPSLFFKFLKRVGLIKLVDWTAGCVAINDLQMEEIFNNIEVPIPITIYH